MLVLPDGNAGLYLVNQVTAGRESGISMGSRDRADDRDITDCQRADPMADCCGDHLMAGKYLASHAFHLGQRVGMRGVVQTRNGSSIRMVPNGSEEEIVSPGGRICDGGQEYRRIKELIRERAETQSGNGGHNGTGYGVGAGAAETPAGEEAAMSFGFLGTPGSGDDPRDPLQAMFAQMGRVFASLGSQEGAIPASLVQQTAIDALSTSGGTSGELSTMTRSELEEAFRLADLWLDEVTVLPATSPTVRAWTRREWVERSTPLWIEAVTPIAEKMSSSMTQGLGQMSEQMGGDLGPMLEQFGAGFAQMQGVFERLGGAMFATQLGQALGRLAEEVLSSTDVGIAIAEPGERVLLPANVEAWADGMEIDRQQVLLFLALRESAAVRLFTENGWISRHLISAIHDYARGITIDLEALQQQAERAMEQLQGNVDPESLAEVAQVFEVPESAQQTAALRRLETHLALIEGWVDHVVSRAAAERLRDFPALAEMARRRRAAGGPAEAIFATLVGLELRPRRLRDAANLWAALEHAFTSDGRDDVWRHPESLPTYDDLDDPLGYIETIRMMRDIPDDLSSLDDSGD